MEFEKDIRVTPERTEVMVAVTAEGAERLATVKEIKYAPQEEYRGPTTFTPSEEIQRISTAGLLVTADIIINPVPGGYGRIAWNGRGIRIY